MRCLHCGYSLVGLESNRCPECGSAFAPVDPRTYAADPPLSRTGLLIAASFLGAFGAWIVLAGVMFVLDLMEYGMVRGVEEDLVGCMVLVLAWWLLLILPLLFVRRVQRMYRRLGFATALTTGPAMALFWVLAGRNLQQQTDVVVFSLTVLFAGVVAGVTSWIAMRPRWVRSAVPTPMRARLILWLIPPVTVGFVALAVWPALCRLAPDIAYRLSDDETQVSIVCRVLRDFEVGDAESELVAKLPAAFGLGFPVSRGGVPVEIYLVPYTVRAEAGRYSYEVAFADGVITRIEVQEPDR